jgi:HTH-type transcriptional regulator/antitoxin HipB
MQYTITTLRQLGHVLAGFRKQMGMTQSELGARAGLLQKMISALEADPGRTSVARLFSILSALELELVLGEKRAAPAPHARAGRRRQARR